VFVHFEGNAAAPAELALGEGGEEESSTSGSQRSAEMKGEDLQGTPP